MKRVKEVLRGGLSCGQAGRVHGKKEEARDFLAILHSPILERPLGLSGIILRLVVHPN